MASNTSYTPPGTYVTETFAAATPALNPGVRIPVLIGEGQEFFSVNDVAVIRGSSATQDNQSVDENISNQANGSNRTYQVQHYPITNGNGTGTTTTNPSDITVTANGIPVTVLSVNGTKGTFTTQTIIPAGTVVEVTYYYKNTDTLIVKENDSYQIPTYATLSVGPLNLQLSTPGELGNNVTLALTESATGVADAQAITGNGTDAISIELRNTDGTIRTYAYVGQLLSMGVSTADGGIIVVLDNGNNTPAVPMAATNFTGGAGPNTNTSFFLQNVPVVDGTNGGIVTTNPAHVTALVNGLPVTVSALNGTTGYVTLANPVESGSILEFTYYTNTYKNTGDPLPSPAVASVTSVGYGPGRTNFYEGIDYALSGNQIMWGDSYSVTQGTTTSGYTPFTSSSVNVTLTDDYVYLRAVNGTATGRNSVFTLPDVPVTGSGYGITTNDPSLVKVYVGANPPAALAAGPVRVSSLSGASAQVTLYNPPAAGMNVYASYFRSRLVDNEYTLTVMLDSGPNVYFGSYIVQNSLGQPATAIGWTSQGTSVASPGFSKIYGPDFPNSNLASYNNYSSFGAANENITLTFQNDGLTLPGTSPVQASLDVAGTLVFTAATPGAAGNSVQIVLASGGEGVADAQAITQSGTNNEIITVELNEANGSTVRTWGDIITLFSTYPPTVSGAGQILCQAVSNPANSLTSQATAFAATNLTGGVTAVPGAPYANRFCVTSNRTAAQAAADGLGMTGGATTPAGGNGTTSATAVGASGYLGQTYIDATGAEFTIIDPYTALNYGYTQLPSNLYHYAPGDTLVLQVSQCVLPGQVATIDNSIPTGVPIGMIPGVALEVTSIAGMNIGDSVILTTFNRSGNAPSVGETYYVSYTTPKSASQMGLTAYTKDSDAYAVYGQPTTLENRLSLAIKFLTDNGAVQFACIQVPKQVGLGVASDQSFIDAINSLSTPIPGSGRRADVILPMSTSENVQQALSTFLLKQATPTIQGYASAYIGFDAFTTAAQMATITSSIANQRVVATNVNSAGVMLQSSPTEAAIEYPVTGEFVAAALAGLAVSPNNDVATDITGQKVVGFTRSLIVYDVPTMNMLAQNGITVLTDDNGALEVRDFLTTDMSNILTKKPYVTTTADYIGKAFRIALKQFKGRKEVSVLPNSIKAVLNGLLKSWASNNSSAILSAYGQLQVTQDVIDPTTFNISVPVQPIFSALYFNVSLSVSVS